MVHHLKSTAHVAGLWALAVAQPIFDLLTRSPEFFVAHRAGVLDALLLAVAVAIVPPVVLGGAIFVAALPGRRIANVVTAMFVGALGGVIALQAAYRLGLDGWSPALTVWFGVLALIAFAWLRIRAVRTFFTVLSPATFVIPLLLLGSEGVRSATSQAASSNGVTVSGSTPVVLVVFDELPLASLLDDQGRLDTIRYPNFAALAGEAIWYRKATAVSDFTRWAVPAILTGRYPVASQLPTVRDHPESIFTLLSPHYEVKAQEPITALCPRSICVSGDNGHLARLAAMLTDVRVIAAYVFLPPKARRGLPDLTQGWAGFATSNDNGGSGSSDVADDDAESKPAENVRRSPDLGPGVGHLDAARALIASIVPSAGRPGLYVLHTLLSHHPPRWLPTGQLIRDRQGAPARDRQGRWVADPWPVVQHYQGHLLQVALADRLLGELLGRLKSAGLFTSALVIVTSDHGASFRPGELMREVTDTNAADILAVPLIVKLPRNTGSPPSVRIDDRPAETIDILPTVADVLGITMPWHVDGVSLVRAPVARRVQRIFVDDATRAREFAAADIAMGLTSAIEWKRSLFGTDPWPATRVPGTEGLLGREAGTLSITPEVSGLRPRLTRPLALEDVDPSARVLPAQVTGWIEPRSYAQRHPVALAVAVNDRIVATTRTLPRDARWSTLLPPSTLQRGANRLTVFIVDPDHPEVLRLAESPASAGTPPNLALGAAAAIGVEQSGFHRSEVRDGVPFRWTSGDASIKVPIDPARPPKRLELSVLASGPTGKQLHVSVDRCEALDARLPRGRWEKTIALGRCTPHGYWADISIRSDVHTPSAGDRRRLGVALTRVTLE